MLSLSIGQVAERAGIAASAIRYYEAEGLLPRAERRSGRRVYDESVVERLAIIQLAKAAGFTVAEVKRLLGGFARRTPPGERWRTMAERKLVELDERIAEAERMKRLLRVVTRCECPSFTDCSRAISKG
ncbi:MAG: MerR family transcriptional regulator [Myxococcota bacterium]